MSNSMEFTAKLLKADTAHLRPGGCAFDTESDDDNELHA